MFAANKRADYDRTKRLEDIVSGKAEFRDPDELFREFFGDEDPFKAFFGGKDPFESFLGDIGRNRAQGAEPGSEYFV